MLIDFKIKDIIHRIAVKFVPASLPGAKKPYYLKAVHQPELDIHGIASKAAVYNIATSPKVIEEGLRSGIELIQYLAADGYRIKTSLFKLGIRIPGEYNGAETGLAGGIFPVARLRVSPGFSKYLKERVKLEFDGVDQSEGIIAEAQDEATGIVGQVMTRGHILTIRGNGLKIESDAGHKELTGVFFTPPSGAPIKAPVIAVNEPRTLKVLVPNELVSGTAYRIAIETMSSVKGAGWLTRKMRDIRSDFSLVA